MRTALLLLLALAASASSGTASAGSTVWKWVDEKGVTHYSDTPVPGATKIEISTGNVSQSRPAYNNSSSGTTASNAAAPGDVYTNFEIWRPDNEQVLINTAGEVNVEIRVEPSLQAGHSLNLYLDGRLVEDYSGGSSHVLHGVSRGTHSLVATINEQSGTRVREVGPVTFTVRQESIAQPPTGPSLRPPPKPQPRTGAANKPLTTQPSYGALNGARPAVDPATNLPVVTKPAPKPKKP
ncbi:MAG TPA: DUF4124 domain-containing protein [Steroidobacteraceae bacterium]|jgi:hypothetical protein|nr:DUF4124 domain-containing protein [Steroidobacteraceae bacterium]